MEPQIHHRDARAERAWAWWNSVADDVSRPPTRFLPASLAIVPVVAAVAMPLVWHHLSVPSPTFQGPPILEIIRGVDIATWLLAVAVVAIAMSVRTYLKAPRLGVKWTITVLAFVTVNGMFIDYLDWNTRGATLYVKAYFGPGFYVGLVAAALTVFAAVLVWRVPD